MNNAIKIHILHTGQVQVDVALPFGSINKSINPFAYTGLFRSKKNQVILPVSTYLIEHPKGLILIDTGWDTDMRSNQIKNLGKLHHMINKAILPKGQAINEQLNRMGILPKDIDYLILTHLHSDHVSGLKLVREAKNILVSEEELKAARKDKLRYIHHMWEDVNLKTFHMSPSNYGPQNRSFDLFGDDSVVFVHTPGHSKGLVSTIIQRNGKYVLLAADTGYAKKSWEQMILPGVSVNKKQLIQSLQWVKEMASNPNCIEALANHDADIKPHTIKL